MNCTNTFFDGLIHLLYPHICSGCGTDLLDKEQLLCLDCFAGLPLTGFQTQPSNPVEKMFWGRIAVQSATSFCYFSKQSVIQRLLHLLKYSGRKEIGVYFGRLLADSLLQSGRFRDVDALIPLPLHFIKQKKRGYNQAEMICEGIAEKMNVPVLTNVVTKKIKTDTQTRKNRMQRWKNIEDKFELKNESEISGRHILLVDDVITTGATIEACGAELLRSDNTRLSIASLAYTTL